MVPIFSFSGRRVVVFGLGLSGKSACLALEAGGAVVWAGDDNPAKRCWAVERGFSWFEGDQESWCDVAALILSPGVPLTHPRPHWIVECAKNAGVEIIGDTELFERERKKRAPRSRLVAVTGTNGKSTTVAFIAHILGRAGLLVELGGNIGRPVLSLNDVSDDAVYVLEYSSYQLELTPSLAPDVGVLLNLSADHLDRHGSMESYAAAKERLVYATVLREGTVVIGVDDSFCTEIADRAETYRGGHEVLRISTRDSLERGVFAVNNSLCECVRGSVQCLVDLSGCYKLKGIGNLQNVVASFTACRALGVREDKIVASLGDFTGLRHRMESVGRQGKVLFINDSKATNASASACALLSFKPIYWIVGGRAKSEGIEPLVPLFPRIAHAFLIGEAASDFAKTLNGKVMFTISGNLETAVAQATAAAVKSSAGEPVVLLSPACASFDQFANFEERGDAFCALVGDLSDGVE